MHDLINVDFSLLYSYFALNIFKWSYLAQKWLFLGQFAPPRASTRRGLPDGVCKKICPQNPFFLKSRIYPRPLGEVGVKKKKNSSPDLTMRIDHADLTMRPYMRFHGRMDLTSCTSTWVDLLLRVASIDSTRSTGTAVKFSVLHTHQICCCVYMYTQS